MEMPKFDAKSADIIDWMCELIKHHSLIPPGPVCIGTDSTELTVEGTPVAMQCSKPGSGRCVFRNVSMLVESIPT